MTLFSRFCLIFCFISFLHGKAQDAGIANAAAYTNFSAAQFKDKYKTAYTLIQVSSVAEYKQEHAKGAILLDLNAADVEQQLAALDRNNNLFLYSITPNASAQAAELLAKSGFKNIIRLNGTWSDLKAIGISVAK